MAVSPQHLERLRLRHLGLLELIEDNPSLRTIANKLNVSQPAVSTMLRELENAFDCQLVDRSSRGVSLNPAGRQALQRIRVALSSIKQVSQDISSKQKPLLRIGSNPQIISDIFPDVLRMMRAKHGGMRFDIKAGRESAMMQSLVEGDIDCYVGVVDWNRLTDDIARVIHHEPLRTARLTLACSKAHPLAGRSDIVPADLLEWDWALQPVGSNVRKMLEAAFMKAGLAKPTPAIELSADPYSFLSVAARVDVVVCIPETALQHFGNSHKMHEILVPHMDMLRTVTNFITMRQSLELAPLLSLRDALLETLSVHPATW